MRRSTKQFLSLLTLLLTADALFAAAPFSPTQGELAGMVGPTDFGKGSVASVTPDGEGVKVIGTLGDEQSFSRFVVRKDNYNTDLSKFATVEATVEKLTADITQVKLFVQTGDTWEYFESPAVDLELNKPKLLTLDLSGVKNANNVRQIGFQVFGAAGEHKDQAIRITVNPAPTTSPAEQPK